MTAQTRKRMLLIAGGALVMAAVIYGFLPDPLSVQTVRAERGPLRVIVEEEGETQVEERYAISSPVAAFARRVEVEVGDVVEAGQPVVRLEPPRSAILDPRTRAEAVARVEAARAAVAQASEQTDAAGAAAERAGAERRRVERLAADASATPQALEQATAEAARTEADLAAARAGVVAARADLDAAQAALRGSAGDANLPVQDVLRAPAAGRVLAVHRRSEGAVSPGEPLVEVGDTERLEVRVDVLSQDAVRIRPGTRVLIDQWGGGTVLDAVVDRVGPDGFTDVSSLGVEERRVPVVAHLVSPPEAWAGLGSGYRVLARFVVWEDADALQVPTGAVFRTEDGWAVFVVEDGRAVRRAVAMGQQAGLATQILSGLDEGETVIVHPATALDDGTRVRVE